MTETVRECSTDIATLLTEPCFHPSECGNDPCTERWCPYTHGSGWAIHGVEGLFSTADEARAALSQVQP